MTGLRPYLIESAFILCICKLNGIVSMKKEIFRFLYENEAGRDDHFNLPIFYNDEKQLEAHVRMAGEDYMRFNAIGGTLYEAHSTESDRRYRFNKAADPREFWYVGVFMRLVPDGTYDRRVVRRCYKSPHPIVINKKLVEDFIQKIADKNQNTKGYQLVSLYLDEEQSGVHCNEDNTHQVEGPQGVPIPKWIRVKDDAGLFSWVPGLMWPDGSVKTIFGEMKDPESEEDTREFDDCPFEGYKIVKEEK